MYCEVVILGLTMCYKRIRAEIREGSVPSRRINSLWLVPYEYVEEVKNGKEDNK